MHTGSPLGRRAKLTGTRVLVVEDEIFASMLVEDELRDAGATVLGPAPSVGDALRLVEAAAADGGISAAVLDINLDGRHVAPVADRLAALGVPFVFATGYGEHCDRHGHGAAPVLVSSSIDVAHAILTESALSFLGFGVRPPFATWGNILADGRTYIFDAPWLFAIPGCAILVVVLSFNLVGEGLRDAMNPKLRKRSS